MIRRLYLAEYLINTFTALKKERKEKVALLTEF